MRKTRSICAILLDARSKSEALLSSIGIGGCVKFLSTQSRTSEAVHEQPLGQRALLEDEVPRSEEIPAEEEIGTAAAIDPLS